MSIELDEKPPGRQPIETRAVSVDRVDAITRQLDSFPSARAREGPKKDLPNYSIALGGSSSGAPPGVSAAGGSISALVKMIWANQISLLPE